MIPWESDEASFPGDLFRSWLGVMLRPVEFFRALDPNASFAKPLIFFLVFSVLGSAATTLSWMAVFGDSYRELTGAGEAFGGFSASAYAWFNFFASPFLALIGLAINVAFTHVGVLVFVPTRKKIGITARAYCYVAAPGVMALIPFLGWAFAPVWVLVLTVIGIQRTHETSLGRAAAAVLVPPLVVAFAFGLLIFLLFFLMVALGGQV